MKHDKTSDTERDTKRNRVIRTAEWVLSQAYRSAPREEIAASQFRIREAIVREGLRRTRK